MTPDTGLRDACGSGPFPVRRWWWRWPVPGHHHPLPEGWVLPEHVAEPDVVMTTGGTYDRPGAGIRRDGRGIPAPMDRRRELIAVGRRSAIHSNPERPAV